MTFKELARRKSDIKSVRLGLIGANERLEFAAERWQNEGGDVKRFDSGLAEATAAAMESVSKKEISLLLFDGFDFLNTVRYLEEHIESRAKPLLALQGIEVESYDKTLWTGIAPLSKWNSVKDVLPELRAMTDALKKLDDAAPRVALLSCVETISTGIPSTVWEGTIGQMCRRGQLGNVIVDGPLAFDLAVSPEAVRDKGVETDVNGRADLLIPPDLNTYCSMVDALHLSGQGSSAGVVLGTPCPVALPSRFAAEDDIWLSVQIANLLRS